MRAISAFSRDDGISTRVCFAVTALRIRVSMSAMGSVIPVPSNLVSWSIDKLVNHQFTNLPTTLCYPCDVALERQLAKAQAAQRKLPHVGARAPAQVAAVAQPDLELRCLL